MFPLKFTEQLHEVFGERFTQALAIRTLHGRAECFHPEAAPDGVVYPDTTEEVALALRLCSEFAVPVIPFGVGSSLEGHILAVNGGLSIDTSRMSAVLDVSAEDMDCHVQAGLTRKALNVHLRDLGVFFPVDPGADASLGGMAATRASGTTTVRYGAMRANVLGLTVVTPQGEIIRTGTRARKSAAGYDLTALYLGSEGTLGIITELRLRLYPVPECIASAVCAFPTVRSAVDAVIETIQLGVPVARIELLDALSILAVNRHAKSAHHELPTLFLEFQGSPADVEGQAAAVAAIARNHGGADFSWSTLAEERNRLWQARHDAYFAALALAPGKSAVVTDVCVPISALAQCITQTQEEIAAEGLIAPILGHVGDGNFHLIILVDPSNRAETDAAKRFAERVSMRAIEAGGTCTGEHGVGLGKKHLLVFEHGAGVATMRAIKRALDPQGIMNPGKVFD